MPGPAARCLLGDAVPLTQSPVRGRGPKDYKTQQLPGEAGSPGRVTADGRTRGWRQTRKRDGEEEKPGDTERNGRIRGRREEERRVA